MPRVGGSVKMITHGCAVYSRNIDEIAVASVAAGACIPAMRTAVAARRLMAPAGRASRRIAGDVTTVGVEDATSIERIVTGAAFAGAAMTKRDCAGEAKRHSVSSSSMRST